MTSSATRNPEAASTLYLFESTFSSFSDGLNEDSNTDVAKTLSALNTALCGGLGAAIFLVHHTGHSALDRARGASAFFQLPRKLGLT